MAVATAENGGFRPEAETSESANNIETMREGQRAANALGDSLEETFGVSVDMMGVVRVIGGTMIGIAILVVVLNEVFALDSINNSSGEFSSVIDSLESTGGAALGLLVIGLLVVGANRVMGFFGGGGF
jgi:hypothetical protein